MDFVISKVGVSLCALLALSVLGGELTEPQSVTEHEELKAIGRQFDDLISSMAEGGCEARCVYDVPWLSMSLPIVMTIWTGGVEVKSERAQSVVATSNTIHLWPWDGADLNTSTVDELNSSCDPLAVASGDRITLAVRVIPVQSVLKTMVFVSAAGSG